MLEEKQVQAVASNYFHTKGSLHMSGRSLQPDLDYAPSDDTIFQDNHLFIWPCSEGGTVSLSTRGFLITKVFKLICLCLTNKYQLKLGDKYKLKT